TMDYKRVNSPPATAPPHELDQSQQQQQQLYPQMPMPQVMPIVVNPAPPPPPSVVHHQTTVLIDSGQGMICPHCNARIRVRAEYHPTGKTYCLSAILCLFLCWPCVCVPCCCNCCYENSQFCPNCNARLGSF
ncbi:hypothetical protein KR038_003633, partial [Drosophila bunnanda]